MVKISPAKLVMIRKKLEPIATEYELEPSELLTVFKTKCDQFKGLVDEDTIVDLIRIELKELQEVFETEEEIEEEEIKQPIKKEKVQVNLDGKEVNNMPIKSYWDNFKVDFPPWLKIQNGLTFTLELEDPSKEPRADKSKNFNRPQWIWDVILLDIDKKAAFDDTDDEGRPIYVKGRTYSLSMGKKHMERFKAFWEEQNFDVKKFTMKRFGEKFQTDYIFSA